MCARAYTCTHLPTTPTPAKVGKYKRQNPYYDLYPCQNIAPHTSKKCQTWTSAKRFRFQLPPAHACWRSKTPLIHTHVVERLEGANKQNVHTRVYMYTLWRVWSQVYTLVSKHLSRCIYLSALACKAPVWCSFPPMYPCTHANTPGMTALQRLHEELMQMQEALHVSCV